MGSDGRVVAAVIRRGDEYLVGRRPKEKRHGGLWEFPGGKAREGESDSDAIARELREELELQVRSVGRRLFSASEDGPISTIEFYEVEVSGKPVAREHSELSWTTPGGLLLAPLAPADARFVREVLAVER